MRLRVTPKVMDDFTRIMKDNYGMNPSEGMRWLMAQFIREHAGRTEAEAKTEGTDAQ